MLEVANSTWPMEDRSRAWSLAGEHEHQDSNATPSGLGNASPWAVLQRISVHLLAARILDDDLDLG